MTKLVVVSNHNPKNWSQEQLNGWDEVIYIPFPNVDPNLDSDQVYEMAKNLVFNNFDIISNSGNITVQGEFSLTYYIISFIKTNPLLTHVKVLIPTTERVSVETVEEGKTVKSSIFKFVKWREI